MPAQYRIRGDESRPGMWPGLRCGVRVVLINNFGTDKMLGVVESGSLGTVCTNPIKLGSDSFDIGVRFDKYIGGILTFQDGYGVFVPCRDLMVLDEESYINTEDLPPLSDLF